MLAWFAWELSGNSPSLCPKVNFHSISLGKAGFWDVWCTLSMASMGRKQKRRRGGRRMTEEERRKGEQGEEGGGEERKESRTNRNRRLPSWTLLTSLLTSVPSPLCPLPFSRSHQKAARLHGLCCGLCSSGKGCVSLGCYLPTREAFRRIGHFWKHRYFGGCSHKHFLQWALQSCDKVLYLSTCLCLRGQRKITFQ